MAIKRDKYVSWFRSYKPDDIAYIMLMATGQDKNYWPTDLCSLSAVMQIQLLFNTTVEQRKYWVTPSGQSKSRSVNNYISFRIAVNSENKANYEKDIKNWQLHPNYINHMITARFYLRRSETTDEILTIRFELTEDIMNALK